MYLYNLFAHLENVVGVRLVASFNLTTHIASTIQQETPGGTVVVHVTGDMSC